MQAEQDPVLVCPGVVVVNKAVGLEDGPEDDEVDGHLDIEDCLAAQY